MQDVQTLAFLTTPLITAFTDCRFGTCLYTLDLLEKDLLQAFKGDLPHISHCLDICFFLINFLEYCNDTQNQLKFQAFIFRYRIPAQDTTFG